MDKISVLLAAKKESMSGLLRNVLGREEWIDVVGECSDRELLVAQAEKLNPSIVILDESLSGKHLSTCEEIMHVCPGIRVVLLGSGGKSPRFAYPEDQDKDIIESPKHTRMMGFLETVTVDSNPSQLVNAINGWRKFSGKLNVDARGGERECLIL